jgi:hypothetical protein
MSVNISIQEQLTTFQRRIENLKDEIAKTDDEVINPLPEKENSEEGLTDEEDKQLSREIRLRGQKAQ